MCSHGMAISAHQIAFRSFRTECFDTAPTRAKFKQLLRRVSVIKLKYKRRKHVSTICAPTTRFGYKQFLVSPTSSGYVISSDGHVPQTGFEPASFHYASQFRGLRRYKGIDGLHLFLGSANQPSVSWGYRDSNSDSQFGRLMCLAVNTTPSLRSCPEIRTQTGRGLNPTPLPLG